MANMYEQATVASQLAQIIRQHTGSNTAITPEMDLLNDLAIDSLELVELALVVEKALKIKLSMAEVRRCTTVGELTQLAEQTALEEQVKSV